MGTLYWGCEIVEVLLQRLTTQTENHEFTTCSFYHYTSHSMTIYAEMIGSSDGMGCSEQIFQNGIHARILTKDKFWGQSCHTMPQSL